MRSTAARVAVVTALSLGSSAVAVVGDSGAEVTTSAVRVVDQPRTFSVVAVGDWLSENRMNDAAIAYASAAAAAWITRRCSRRSPRSCSRPTLAICHMETPITGPGCRYGWMGQASPTGPNLIGAPNEVAGDLQRVGFDRCSTASNHSWDLGANGIATTLEALDAAGIAHVGTARTPDEAALTLFTVRGVRVAHLAYTRTSNTGFPGDAWRVNHSTGAIAADVQAVRVAGAEVVIVSLHVSTEMQRSPTPDDRALVASFTAASDVDLVIMHGPHTIQPRRAGERHARVLEPRELRVRDGRRHVGAILGSSARSTG